MWKILDMNICKHWSCIEHVTKQIYIYLCLRLFQIPALMKWAFSFRFSLSLFECISSIKSWNDFLTVFDFVFIHFWFTPKTIISQRLAPLCPHALVVNPVLDVERDTFSFNRVSLHDFWYLRLAILGFENIGTLKERTRISSPAPLSHYAP